LSSSSSSIPNPVVTPPGPLVLSPPPSHDSSGVVYMKEESNMEHSHFGGVGASDDNDNGGIQAMNE
jgi:hypothetical protein